MSESNAAKNGRIGGLTAWSRNDAATMIGPAHRGFRARFERLVDPEGRLSEAERSIRADRARRAHMLSLAAKSAESRRRKAPAPLTAKPDGRNRRGGKPTLTPNEWVEDVLRDIPEARSA